MQWCYFQGQRDSTWNEYRCHLMVYCSDWNSCKYGNVCNGDHRRYYFNGSNLILRPFARKFHPITSSDESEKQYRISVTCQEKAEQDIRLLLINSNSCKTLFLNNLESGDVVGDKVEIVAEYCSVGKSKNNILEGIVGQVLVIPEVISAGWEVL
ncbi:putative magnesium-transporting ATPase protein C [Clostridioides difficile DA00128]|nr:putative magnesium-transporting ATPase protein C [Clostridioides difficile DA00128]